jgi:hypothetical protein
MFTFVKINFKLQLIYCHRFNNMLAQDHRRLIFSEPLTYTGPKVTNLYMVNIGDCDVAINDP